jgi:hypothetical protein
VQERRADRKSVEQGKSVDLGGRRIIKKKKSKRGEQRSAECKSGEHQRESKSVEQGKSVDIGGGRISKKKRAESRRGRRARGESIREIGRAASR